MLDKLIGEAVSEVFDKITYSEDPYDMKDAEFEGFDMETISKVIVRSMDYCRAIRGVSMGNGVFILTTITEKGISVFAQTQFIADSELRLTENNLWVVESTKYSTQYEDDEKSVPDPPPPGPDSACTDTTI